MTILRPFKSLTVAIFILFCLAGYSQKAPDKGKFAVIAYSIDRAGEVDKYPVEKLTHIIYSFLHLQGNVLMDHGIDSISISHLVSLKQRNPSLKVILSLGGWGGCPSCPEVFATQHGRDEFSQSVKLLLDKYKADGIDLDWEYPAIESVPGYTYSPADKHNFTLLIQSLRKTLGSRYEISFAAGGFRDFLVKSVEWDQVMPLLNYVNLMTYDYINGYSTHTGHHTPLYSTPEQTGSADFVVHFLDSLGVPRNKMIIGAAFYARVFKDVTNRNHGLYEPCSFAAYINYRDFDSYFSKSSGFEMFWDSIAKAPYAYNAQKQLFATFDDKHSIELKTRYALKSQLGGIMFWSLNGDTYENGLLEVIDKTNNKSH